MDEILIHNPRVSPAMNRLLVFYITGNPGLISYYETFLTHLHSRIQTVYPDLDLYVYGASLRGFELGDGPQFGTRPEDHPRRSVPLDLKDQIAEVGVRLKAVTKQLNKQWPGDEPLPVVLIGHSIGAYMVVETLARHIETTSSKGDMSYNPVGGVCLMPTIMELAQSPMGKRMAPLLTVPGMPHLVHYLARLCLLFVPLFVLNVVVTLITGLPPGASRITARFLKSKTGIVQGLHLAKHEFLSLTTDRWTEDFWGSQAVQDTTIKTSPIDIAVPVAREAALYFLFAREDHWVPPSTQQYLIRNRGRRGSLGDERKPLMEVEETGEIGHGFCVRQDWSKTVAEKVARWISDEVVSGSALDGGE